MYGITAGSFPGDARAFSWRRGRLPECRITHEHRVACGNLVIVTYNLLIWVNAKEPGVSPFIILK